MLCGIFPHHKTHIAHYKSHLTDIVFFICLKCNSPQAHFIFLLFDVANLQTIF